MLRAAFESQDVSRLQQAVASMSSADAKYHMKRCVDSGLWVARDESIFEDGDDDDGEGDGEGKEDDDGVQASEVVQQDQKA